MKKISISSVGSIFFYVVGLVMLVMVRNEPLPEPSFILSILVITIGLILTNTDLIDNNFEEIDRYIHEEIEPRITEMEKNKGV